MDVMTVNYFFTIKWDPAYKPALIPGNPEEGTRPFFTITWRAPSTLVHYPFERERPEIAL
jgi:hypothetical protein